MCVRARSIKSAIEFVCAHIKDKEWLAYWNVRWDMCSLSLWHGYLLAALDYRCVWGKREAQLTIEVKWLVYVWKRREAYLMY